MELNKWLNETRKIGRGEGTNFVAIMFYSLGNIGIFVFLIASIKSYYK
jgi:hypothetical protein